VVLRALVQKVDSLANFPFHRGHRAAARTVYLARLAALGASAGLDVALRPSAARFPESSRELDRDSPWAAAELVQLDAPQARLVPQPLVAQAMA
jgi:hypothetical protein